MKGKNHLIVIGLLSIVFFGLIFLSTSDSNININYTFNDVEMTFLPEYDNQILLGNVEVENNGLIPKRVFLDQFVICQLSEEFGDETYKIEYKGKTDKEYGDIFGGYYRYRNYVEISSNEKVELEIVPQLYRYHIIDEIKQFDLNGKTMPFYVFKLDEMSRYEHDYCSSVKKEDAYKVINVEFNIPESQIYEDENVATTQKR